jgi:hypothetical protein
MADTLPAPIMALRRLLRGATNDGERDRVSVALRRCETLYKLPTASPDDDITGETRRRQFAGARHNVWVKNKP